MNFLHETRPKLVDEENGFKKVLIFYSFYKANTLYWIEFVLFLFDILLFFSGICLHTTQNIMFSALKPKSKTN